MTAARSSVCDALLCMLSWVVSSRRALTQIAQISVHIHTRPVHTTTQSILLCRQHYAQVSLFTKRGKRRNCKRLPNQRKMVLQLRAWEVKTRNAACRGKNNRLQVSNWVELDQLLKESYRRKVVRFKWSEEALCYKKAARQTFLTREDTECGADVTEALQ